MFVTDVVVDKQSLSLVNLKVKTSLAFMIVFSVGILLSIANIIFGIVTKISDYNTYLFSAFGILIAGFWLYASFRENKRSKQAYNEISEKGTYIVTGEIEVNAEHKLNHSTILNLVCAILVAICLIVEIFIQIFAFNPLTVYIISITFVLTSYMIYQTLIGLVNDKIYRNAIISK